MSDDVKTPDQNQEEPKSESGFGFNAFATERASFLEMEFLDGFHVVPEYIIRHLGGEDAVSRYEDYYRTITFHEFTGTFHRMVEADGLNRIQDKIVSDFLRRRQHPLARRGLLF